AHAPGGERSRRVIRKPQGVPEAPAARRLAGGIDSVSQLPDLRALQGRSVDVIPVVIYPQLAPFESGERHAMVQARELARARAAGIRGLVDVAHQARHEARLAEGGHEEEGERQSASPQAAGKHERRIPPPPQGRRVPSKSRRSLRPPDLTPPAPLSHLPPSPRERGEQ